LFSLYHKKEKAHKRYEVEVEVVKLDQKELD